MRNSLFREKRLTMISFKITNPNLEFILLINQSFEGFVVNCGCPS